MPVPDLASPRSSAPVDPARSRARRHAITLRRRDGRPSTVGARPLPARLRSSSRSRARRRTSSRATRAATADRHAAEQPAFLSPVLLFRQTQPIHDRSFPLDTFAVPALHRIVHVLYFCPADLAAFADAGLERTGADRALRLPTTPALSAASRSRRRERRGRGRRLDASRTWGRIPAAARVRAAAVRAARRAACVRSRAAVVAGSGAIAGPVIGGAREVEAFDLYGGVTRA